MDTELKVLIYRTGNEEKKTLPERKKKNRTISILKSSMAALSVITAVLGAFLLMRTQPAGSVAPADAVVIEVLEAREEPLLLQEKAPEAEKTVTEAPEAAVPETEIPAAETSEAEAEVQTEADAEAETDEASKTEADAEAEERVYLLNDKALEEKTEYIPATLGGSEPEAENEAEPEPEPIPSRPSDLPEGLTFTYNEGMKLPLNSEEINSMYQIVEAEAEGESVYGKMLVANVIINRVHDSGFADNVMDVIFEKSGGDAQFSPITDGRYWSVTPDGDTKEAVTRVLSGEDYSQGALFFIDRRYASKEGKKYFDNELKYLFKYGCHEFYTDD